jgi:hypothetical protein
MKAIADLKLLGKGRELTIGDWRKASQRQTSWSIGDTLIKRGLVKYCGRNAYVLTELAWAESAILSSIDQHLNCEPPFWRFML